MAHLANFALVVKEYDEAIDFFSRILDFELVEDAPMSAEKRWVRMRPRGAGEKGACLLLAKAKAGQTHAIGDQHAGRVGFFIHTDDFDNTYQRIIDNNVTIVRSVSEHDYGRVMVFADLYGNLWDLIEPK